MDPCRYCDHEKFQENPRIFRVPLLITSVVGALELVGSRFTGSSALFADFAHVATHGLALSVGMVVATITLHNAARSDELKAWGAFVNALSFIILSFWVFFEAYERWVSPRDILAGIMLVVAVIGLVANAVVEKMLRHQATHDLNARGVYIHIVGDYASSIGTILAAGIIYVWRWNTADAVAAALVGFLMLVTGIQVLVEAFKKLRSPHDNHDHK